MDLAVWKRYKAVTLEEVENALAKKVHYNADMTPVIEAVAQMNASVPVFFVVGLESGEYTQFYP